MKVKLVSHTMDIEKVVALGARTCYSNKDMDSLLIDMDNVDKQTNMVEKLLEWGHESPIEHASFTFMVEGISRSTAQQLTRHRIASYSQRSQRYVSEDNFSYVTPKRIEKDERSKKLYDSIMQETMKNYDKLIDFMVIDELKHSHKDIYENLNALISIIETEKKISIDVIEYFKKYFHGVYSHIKKKVIEDARYILPNACSTTIVFTMNLRSLKNFFGLRMCSRSQNEIRELATLMKEECLKVSDIFRLIASPRCIQLGYCPEGNKCCGAMETLEELKENIENE